MKLVITFIFSLFFSMLLKSKEHESELFNYNTFDILSFEELIKRAEFNLGEPIVFNSSNYSLIKSAASKKYALAANENNQYLSLYIVKHLDQRVHPFTVVFTELDIPLSNNDSLRPGSFGYELNLLNCQILELYDAKVTTEHLTSISSVGSIRKLGLPIRGMGFDKDLKFPKSLDTLIVRNSYLNIHFFEAVSRLDNLKNLVIIDCGISYGSPLRDGLTYSSESWNNYPQIFKQLSQNLESLKIIDSDPNIFNHIVRENWINLKNLSLLLTFENFDAINYILKDDNNINGFPALDNLQIKEYGYSHQRIRSGLNGITIQILSK